MNTIHKITNITSEKIIHSHKGDDGKIYSIYELKCDRTYEHGEVDKNTTVICNQREYEEIQASGCYHVYDK